MDTQITIAVICGTSREGRESYQAAQWVASSGRAVDNVEIIFVDPRDFNLPLDGRTPDEKYTAITSRADAFYIVTPEYNHSYPSSLKRLIDSELKNYFHKPVALAGVSSGPWGGVRACEALLPVMHTLGMPVIKAELYFPKIQEIFDEQGNMKPEFQEQYNTNVHKAFEELCWMARALKVTH